MLKKLITTALISACVSSAYAAETADIHINIAADTRQSRFYLCMPDLGCLSLKAAKRGKVFKIIRPIPMNTLFVLDLATGEIFNQGLPDSCDTTVKTNHSIYIKGRLVDDHGKLRVSGLSCRVR